MRVDKYELVKNTRREIKYVSVAILLCGLSTSTLIHDASAGGTSQAQDEINQLYAVDNEVKMLSGKHLTLLLGQNETAKGKFLNFLAGKENYNNEHASANEDKMSGEIFKYVVKDIDSEEIFINVPYYTQGAGKPFFEIVSLYLTEKAFRDATQLKIVLFVQEDTLLNYNDSCNLYENLSHLSSLIPDVLLYNQGVCLIINAYSRGITNELIVSKLNSMTAVIDDKFANCQTWPHTNLANMHDLLNIISNRKLIGIYMQSAENSIKYSKRTELRKLILNDTIFIARELLKFKFEISMSSERYIHEHLNQIIHQQASLNKIECINKLQVFYAKNRQGFEDVFDFVRQILSDTEFLEYAYELTMLNEIELVGCGESNGNSSKEFLSLISGNNILSFFNKFSVSSDSIVHNWMTPTNSFLTHLRQFYKFLFLVDSKQRQYNHRLKKLHGPNNFITFIRTESIELDLLDLSRSLDIIDFEDISFIWSSSENIVQFMVDDLNCVLRHNKQNTNFTLNENSILFVDGYFILLSEIKDYITDNNLNIKKLYVTSLDTFYVDLNINCLFNYNQSETEISIIAPTWNIVGQQYFDIEGKFLGIGQFFENGLNLTITSLEENTTAITLIELEQKSGIVVSSNNSHDELNNVIPTCVIRFENLAMSAIPYCSHFTLLCTFIDSMHLNNDIFTSLNDEHILHIYDNLETQYSLSPKVGSFHLFYESLARAIGMHKKYDNRLSIAVLSAITAKLLYVQGSQYFLPIDLMRYSEFVLRNADEIEDTLKEKDTYIFRHSTIHSLRNDTFVEIARNIDDVKKFIGKTIHAELKTIHLEIHSNIKELVFEVNELQRDAKYHHKGLKEKESAIKDNIRLNQILGPMKITASVCNTIGSVLSAIPILGLFGTLISAGSSVATGVLSGVEASQRKTVDTGNLKGPVPDKLRDAIQEINNLKLQMQPGKQKLGSLIELVEKTIKSYPEIETHFQPILKYKLGIENSDVSDLQASEIFKSVQSGISGIIYKIRNSEVPQIKNNIQRINSGLDILEGSMNIARTVLQHTETAQSDEQQLQLVTTALVASQDDIETVDKYSKGIYNVLIPYLDNILLDMQVFFDPSRLNSSSVYIDIGRWQSKKTIEQVMRELTKIVGVFNAGQKFYTTLSDLQELSNLMSNILERVQNLMAEKRLASYIAAVTEASLANPYLPELNSSSPYYRLQVDLQSYSVLHNYNSLKIAYIQYMYPFHKFSINLQDLNYILKPGGQTNITQLIMETKKEIKRIHDRIIISKTTINTNIDQYLYEHNFDYNFSTPFFVWKFEFYSNVIESFLSGKQIFLNADIKHYPNDKNAIKFKYIDLKIIAKNISQQHALDLTIQHFDINLVHFGDSKYKCDSHLYVIHTTKLPISFSLRKIYNAQPATANEIYLKITNGDISLSPYALWSLQLQFRGKDADKAKAYKVLKTIDADLALVGRGKYVSPESKVCNESLLNYFDHYALMN